MAEYLEKIAQMEKIMRSSTKPAEYTAWCHMLGMTPDNPDLYDLGLMSPDYDKASQKVDRIYSKIVNFKGDLEQGLSLILKDSDSLCNEEFSEDDIRKLYRREINKKPSVNASNYPAFLEYTRSKGIKIANPLAQTNLKIAGLRLLGYKSLRGEGGRKVLLERAKPSRIGKVYRDHYKRALNQ
ncbi:MAG: hypothetical protein ACP5OG_01360 [Candidatus Nanoarchaeia archaeon]